MIANVNKHKQEIVADGVPQFGKIEGTRANDLLQVEGVEATFKRTR